jgi:hypothetical protein
MRAKHAYSQRPRRPEVARQGPQVSPAPACCSAASLAPCALQPARAPSGTAHRWPWCRPCAAVRRDLEHSYRARTCSVAHRAHGGARVAGPRLQARGAAAARAAGGVSAAGAPMQVCVERLVCGPQMVALEAHVFQLRLARARRRLHASRALVGQGGAGQGRAGQGGMGR